jgi:fibronectin type 3 domain-containing protein
VTHVNVTWTASSSTNVVAYNVYRKLSNQTSFSRVATVTGTSFTDTNIDSSVVFDQIQYYVRAVNSSSLESANSNTATVPATVPGGGGPPPPPPF